MSWETENDMVHFEGVNDGKLVVGDNWPERVRKNRPKQIYVAAYDRIGGSAVIALDEKNALALRDHINYLLGE